MQNVSCYVRVDGRDSVSSHGIQLCRGQTLIAKDSLENPITDFQSNRVGFHHFRYI